jgi:trk system potassium uptake protein TrkH
MSHHFPVFSMLGLLLLMMAAAMGAPLAVSIYLHDQMADSYLAGLTITGLTGLLLWRGLYRRDAELQPRHGLLLVALAWVVLPLFAAIPLLLGLNQLERPLPLVHAYFETVSGLTTSGGTVLSGLESLPLSLNFWRTFMQWIGGMGLLILAVAVLPLLGVGGSQLFKVEAAGPLKDSKLTPRITQTAKGLWSVYAGMSLLCTLGYWWAGMAPMDALMHMFTTVSLGGLSNYDSSLGHFASLRIELVAMLFMLLASCNFALFFSVLRKRSLQAFWRDPELHATLALMLGSGLLVSLLLWLKNIYPLGSALRYGMFNTISVASTTGYATADYLHWPIFASVLLVLLSGVATSAGSTGGGIKMVRLLILLKQAKRELQRLSHPRAVRPVTLGGKVVDNHVIFAVLAFIFIYGCTVLVLTMAMLLTELDLTTAFTAVLASVNCMGPGLGAVGPHSNFSVLSEPQIAICTLGMLLGRLEMLSFIALLLPGFWRK